jgi:glycosyltransferase involved in cell wall biosynthesis
VKSKRDHSVFNVLHAGALRDKYGASEIIRAFDYLARNSLPIKLVVLGGTAGPIMEVDLLDKLKRKGVIEIFQQVSFDEVLKKMETSSIGLNIVLPVDQSHYLAQPRKLYEYLSRALPVIAADVPTIREVILKWKCGKLVDPYSDLAISKAIIFAFENKDWLEKAASQSFVAHCTEYNWQLEESKLIKVFDSFV